MILGVSAVYQVKPEERTQAGNITFNKRSGEEGPFQCECISRQKYSFKKCMETNRYISTGEVVGGWQMKKDDIFIDLVTPSIRF